MTWLAVASGGPIHTSTKGSFSPKHYGFIQGILNIPRYPEAPIIIRGYLAYELGVHPVLPAICSLGGRRLFLPNGTAGWAALGCGQGCRAVSCYGCGSSLLETGGGCQAFVVMRT